MPSRAQLPFHMVQTTAPSFNLTVSSSSVATALETTAVREWSGPYGRAVRIAETGGIDCYIQFGTTTVVAASTDSMLLLGNTVEVFTVVRPSFGYIAAYSSTTTTLNITLGYGQ